MGQGQPVPATAETHSTAELGKSILLFLCCSFAKLFPIL